MSFAINAKTLKDGHDCGSKGLPPSEKEVSVIEKVNNGYKKTKLENLIKTVCSKALHAHTDSSKEGANKIGTRIENLILSHLQITKNKKEYKKMISEFWNTNHNKFICEANTHYAKKHLFKIVIDMRIYDHVLLNYFLKEDQVHKFNVNAYEVVNKKPETVLDYLYDIKTGLNSSRPYNIPEIEELIEVLEDEYGALRGKDLLIAPQNNKESH
jgi:hypothetical protein